MNSFNTNAHDFRSKRKCFSMTGCLIFVLLMSQASCRPSETDDTPLYNDGDYTDADDIEWQNFPTVETTTKDHPIIYYKEDIVSEDYDPNKENKSTSKENEVEIKPQSRRKYKEISRRNRFNRTESYRYIKPEKVYFDVYPIEDDGAKEDDTKFNANDIHVEVISLLDENNNNNNNDENTDLKRLLNKRPKKFARRHRQRRDVTQIQPEEHETADHALRHKRNPFSYRFSYYGNQLPQYRGVFYQPRVVIYPVTSVKHPVKGVYYNAVSPGIGKPPGRRVTTTTTTTTAVPPKVDMPDDLEKRFGEPVWDSYPMTTQRNQMPEIPSIPEMTTRPPRRPAPPIIHSGDEDYVPPSRPSANRNGNPFLTTTARPPQNIAGSPSEEQTSRPVTFRPPRTTRPPFRLPITTTTTTPPPPPPPPSEPQPQEASRGISACIWAISSCCTRSENIRYQCFERLGCSGAFWDLNPCADDIFRLAVEAADQFLV